AIEILTSAGEALGVSAAFLVNVLDPGLIVVGGGGGLAGGLYWDAFERACREHIFADSSRTLPITPAKLGIDAGLVGAGAIVFTQSEQQCGHIPLNRVKTFLKRSRCRASSSATAAT